MDWSKGYRATYYMAIVDPYTWRDIDRVKITGGSINRVLTGLRNSADVNCIDFDGEHWIRVYLDAKQGGANEHEALFTGLATSPQTEHTGKYRSVNVECYSVLKPCDDVLLERGWYAPRGRRGGEVIKDLLSVTPAPIDIAENSPTLYNYIIAEDGESNLSMIDRVLSAMNWRLRIGGDGVIHVLPNATSASAVFNPVTFDIIEPNIDINYDWFDSPNVFMAVSDDLTAIAKDETDGPLSIQSRGREIWRAETGVDLTNSEGIGEYARRMLKEAQSVAKTATYSRRYVPDVFPSDIINMQIAENGLFGAYRIESQNIELSHNAKTSETISEVIR